MGKRDDEKVKQETSQEAFRGVKRDSFRCVVPFCSKKVRRSPTLHPRGSMGGEQRALLEPRPPFLITHDFHLRFT